MGKPYVPPFLAKAGLKPGEWMQISKLTAAVLLRPCFELKVRILGALLLQASGYEEELAVVMAKDRFRDKTVTSAITPQGIANVLNRAAVAELKASGVQVTEELKKAIKISRQQIRKALAEMEDDGLIMRVRSNGPSTKLAGLSLHEALERGLITPLADLSDAAKKRLANNVCVYLFAKPRPAKNYDDYVVNLDYINASKSFGSELKGPKQLFFRFTGDVALANELANSEEGQAIWQAVVTAKDNLKQVEHAAKEFAERKKLRVLNPPADAGLVPDAQEKLFPAPGSPASYDTAAVSSRPSASTGSTKGGDAGHSSLVSQPRSAPAPIAQSADTAGEYADGREHLKAIFRAKAGYDAPVDVMDRIELILVGKGKTFEEFVDALKPHLGGRWDIPPAFLTDRAKNIWLHVGAPRLKPKPRCPVCQADNQRGAILQNGAIVACPECSPPGWAEELAAKTRETTARQQTRSAS